MITISVEEMQRDLAGYLHHVQAGETLIITHAGKPLAEVKRVEESATGDPARLRPFGLCAGEFTVPEEFDDPLPEDVLSAFEGK